MTDVRTDWYLRQADATAIKILQDELGVTELVARLLVNRKLVDPTEARAFLAPQLRHLPDPFTMKGMEVAVKRIITALKAGEKICVWGDYDVDGVTSSSQLLLFFRAVGHTVDYYVPDRFVDGYGLNSDGISRLIDDGVSLIITVDCGISNVDEVAVANARGADVIVVDHHQIPPILPAALAILNPVQTDCAFPDSRLAACGVAWILLVGLRKRMREQGWFASIPEPDLREWLDLTAIGTVADMVPLIGVNRVIAAQGLGRIAGSKRPGVQALCAVSAINLDRVTAGTVGFHLGPRINAAGRMAHASAGVELMTTEDRAEADEIAQGVDAYNLERREVQATIFDEAVALVEASAAGEGRHSIVVAKAGWHTGVLGIVASKLVERYYRPTIVLAIEDGVVKGSARSVSGFKLVHHLHRLEQHLDKYGGHDYAAGMTLSESELPAFIAAFEAEAASALDADRLTKRLYLDAEVPLDWVTDGLLEDMTRLAPYGQGNAEPTFLAREVHVYEARTVGADERHVKLTLARPGGGSIDAIAFGQAAHMPAAGSLVDLAFIPEHNHFRDRVTIQLRVKAMRPTGGTLRDTS